MIMLGLGLSLWAAAHFLPSAGQGARDALVERMGRNAYRGVFSLVVLVSLVLIVIGYREADFIPLYDPPGWGVHLNNLLMLISVYLFGAANMRVWVRKKLRHPMLAGLVTWSIAHLIANGDEASVLLFGGMGVWALMEMRLINRREGAREPPALAGVSAELKPILISIAVYAAIAFIHGWVLDVNPFAG